MYFYLIILLVTVLALLLYNFYKWATQNNDFFKIRGIPAMEPTLFFGNTADFFFQKVQFVDFLIRVYNAIPGEKIIGIFNFMTPVYLIRDPEIFKQIAIKDFESFEDRNFLLAPEQDALLGNSVSLLRGQRWRNMRAALSPTFTGIKMRRMFELIRECAIDSTNYFKKECGSSGEVHTDLQDFYARFANDVIASCAFGLKINSLEDRDNQFLATGVRMSKYLRSLQAGINLLCHRIFPRVMRMLNIEHITQSIRQHFRDVVLTNIQERQLKGIIRPDLIDTVMRLQTQNKDQKMQSSEANKEIWTDTDLVAQCFIFFVGGFDTVTWFLVAASYELAIHPDNQDRLIEEIDDITTALNGEPISYDNLNELRYLDMVVSEVLRTQPPVTFVDRVCTKACNFSDGNNINIKFEKGAQILIPIYCYHQNPEYFPDPERFDPERFSEQNKPNMNPAHYVPFGVGPRMCIATRFALMEGKALLYYMLKEFRFEVTSQTEIPIKTLSSAFGLQAKNGLNLKLVLRKPSA